VARRRSHCISLTKLKHGKKGKKFIEFVHRYLPAKHYSRSKIYFLIKFSRAGAEIQQTYVSIGNGIHANMNVKVDAVPQTEYDVTA